MNPQENNLNNLPNTRRSKINTSNTHTPEITPIHNPILPQRNRHHETTDLRNFLQNKLPRKTIDGTELLISIKNKIEHNEI